MTLFKCPECGTVQTFEDMLATDEKIIGWNYRTENTETVEWKYFACGHCGKDFGTADRWPDCDEIEADEDGFGLECPDCGGVLEGFSYEGNSDWTVKKSRCAHCGKAWWQKAGTTDKKATTKINLIG